MRLYGIYHANGGLWGELQYVIGKISGTTHCSLCDITHGLIKEKKQFKTCQKTLQIPLETLHLNEQSEALARFTNQNTPCVVLENKKTFTFVLKNTQLESCQGDVTEFTRLLDLFFETQS